jgi:hypothetical protein
MLSFLRRACPQCRWSAPRGATRQVECAGRPPRRVLRRHPSPDGRNVQRPDLHRLDRTALGVVILVEIAVLGDVDQVLPCDASDERYWSSAIKSGRWFRSPRGRSSPAQLGRCRARLLAGSARTLHVRCSGSMMGTCRSGRPTISQYDGALPPTPHYAHVRARLDRGWPFLALVRLGHIFS